VRVVVPAPSLTVTSPIEIDGTGSLSIIVAIAWLSAIEALVELLRLTKNASVG